MTGFHHTRPTPAPPPWGADNPRMTAATGRTPMTYLINKNAPPRPHWIEIAAFVAFAAAAGFFVGVYLTASAMAAVL